MASGVGGLPDDYIPAPWPEASAEGSAHARRPLKPWDFRCAWRLTQVPEPDPRSHIEVLRFPGKGGREGGGIPLSKAQAAGAFSRGRVAAAGQAWDRGGLFRGPTGGHMRTGQRATCRLVVQADMQTAKWASEVLSIPAP